MSFHDFTRFIFEFLLKLAHMSLLTASHLGTIVASVQVLLHTPHARTHPTHYEYSNKPTTTLRLDRVLEEITGTIHGARRRRARRSPSVAPRVRGCRR